MSRLRESAEYICSYISGIEGIKAQYTVTETETREVSIEYGEFSLFKTVFDSSVMVSVIKDGKPGLSKSNSLEKAALKSAVDNAVISADAGNADEAYDIAPGMNPEVFRIGDVEPDTDKLMQRAEEFLKDVAEKHPKVLVLQTIVQYRNEHSIYGNTNGSEDETVSGYYTLHTFFAGHEGNRSTGLSESVISASNLDRPFIELGSLDSDMSFAEKSLSTVTPDGKFNGSVIFAPNAFAQMAAFALTEFVGDKNMLSGEAKWREKLGQKVASDKLTIIFDPWEPRIVASCPHTNDGFRAEKEVVLKDGILKSYLTGLFVSNKLCIPMAKSGGMQAVVEPGESSLDEMIASIKKGLLVGSVSCGRPGANGEISGIAKNSFLIEDGKIVSAVSETMISFTLEEMLLNISDISSETVATGSTIIPYVRSEGIVISGK